MRCFVVLDYWLWHQRRLVLGGGQFAYYGFDDLLVFGVLKPIFAILPVWRRERSIDSEARFFT